MAPATLAEAIESSNVPFSELEESVYKPMLGIVRELIGVVPNCDQVLEIWPTGFKTYNLVVPTLLDLPKSLVGRGAPKDHVGLGMYISSMAAGCMYCSAHTCSFALRRGASAEAVSGNHSPVQAAVAKLAEGLSFIPASAEVDDIRELRKYLSQDEIDGVAMGVVMMGFLNKFMDALGIGLEAGAINDVEGIIGSEWSVGQHAWNGGQESTQTRGMETDSVKTYARVVRWGPGATKLENQWVKKFSGDSGKDAATLEKSYGFDYGPTLSGLPNKRQIKAFATLLDENLSSANIGLDIETKAKAALIFATAVGNDYLADQARALVRSSNPKVKDAELRSIAGGDIGDNPVLALATAFTPSPAEVTPELVETSVTALAHSQIVELGVWISIQQMLHRLERYRALTDQL